MELKAPATAKGNGHPALRTRTGGTFAILFGLFGAIWPILFLIESVGTPDETIARYTLGSCAVALLAHLYLIWTGTRVFSNRQHPFIGYFFLLESAYGLILILWVPSAVASGLIDPIGARWVADVSTGFTVQLFLAFPLWGWFLIRKTTPSS